MNPSTVYRSQSQLIADGVTADVLAAGDSWFWYPFPGGSLIDQIGFQIANSHNILVVGNNGAEAVDFTEGKYKNAYNEMIRLYGSSTSALFISGGGNDFAGFNDLRPLLKPDCTGIKTAASCFLPGDATKTGTVRYLLQKVFESYQLMVTRALNVMPANGKVYVHTYDYSIPDGRGVGRSAGWLKPALDDAKVPTALQPGCIKFVLDLAADNLARLAASMPDGRVRVVDTRGTLKPNQWANELHPTPSGFKAIAKVWMGVLREDGIAL